MFTIYAWLLHSKILIITFFKYRTATCLFILIVVSVLFILIIDYFLNLVELPMSSFTSCWLLSLLFQFLWWSIFLLSFCLAMMPKFLVVKLFLPDFYTLPSKRIYLFCLFKYHHWLDGVSWLLPKLLHITSIKITIILFEIKNVCVYGTGSSRECNWIVIQR